MPEARPDPEPPRLRIPRAVVVLGLVSLFTDLSSEYIHALLPIYLATSLGASALSIGLIEGTAESLALLVKVVSGPLSDWAGRRKPLVLLGYGLAALSKPLFPLAGGVSLVLGARLMDRLGKGIRGAPRDALVADLTPEPVRGAAYGLRQSLDTAGAVLGPALAIVVMGGLASDLRSALWFAVWPAVVSVVLLWLFVREPEQPASPAARARISADDLRQLSRPFLAVVGIGLLLTVARSTEAFLVLRVSEFVSDPMWAPLALLVMSAAYAATAYPAGRWSDRVDRRWFLLAAFLALAGADLLLARADTLLGACVGVAVWGVHMGLAQGVLSAMVAATAPALARGTAFGVFQGVSAIGLLGASALTGWVWDAAGSSAAFALQAAIAGVGLLAMLGWMGASSRS